MVVHTGAGISTAAGIPDFRGKDGVWTKHKSGVPLPAADRCWNNALPTASHMALAGQEETWVFQIWFFCSHELICVQTTPQITTNVGAIQRKPSFFPPLPPQQSVQSDAGAITCKQHGTLLSTYGPGRKFFGRRGTAQIWGERWVPPPQKHGHA